MGTSLFPRIEISLEGNLSIRFLVNTERMNPSDYRNVNNNRLLDATVLVILQEHYIFQLQFHV